jgi:hypothetical protein
MKSTAGAHRRHPWTVHRLAADFEVIDVWRFEVGSGALGLERCELFGGMVTWI